MSDIRACGSIIRHIAFIDRVPTWARPRFAAKMGLDQMSAAAQLRWTHRFLEDRRKLLCLKFEELAKKLKHCETTRTIDNHSQQAFLAAQEYLKTGIPHPFDPFIETCIHKIMHKLFSTTREPKIIENILRNAAYSDPDKLPEERILQTVQTETQRHLAEAHPALRCILEALADPLERLLLKGEGFIPTPNTFAIITNTRVNSVRNTALLSFMPGHPGIESAEAKLYHQRMANLCRDAQWKDNLDRDERHSLKEAIKDKNTVFFPTDKTGKLLAISKDIMAAAIGKFVTDKQGTSFDIISDPITMGALLAEQKKTLNESVEFFKEQSRVWQEKLKEAITTGATIPTANSIVHNKHFPKGTTAIDKIIKILTAEAKYLPAFGPLKPHIKDHKLKEDIKDISDEAKRQKSIPFA